MKLKNLFWILLLTITLYCFVLLLRAVFERKVLPPLHQEVLSENLQEAFQSKYYFVVIKKYLDSTNHNNETIVGLDMNGKKQVIYGSPGYWELYKIVSIGDTITKKKNSFIFLLTNKDKKIFDIQKVVKKYK